MNKRDICAMATSMAIPFTCKVKLGNGRLVDGMVSGRLLKHPVVHFGGQWQGSIEISWDLASRLYSGEASFVRA